MSNLGRLACELAAAGWPVFPCKGKEPLTAHGHLDGTADPVRVGMWWERWPTANIAARVPDSLLVIDIDPRNGGANSLAELEAAHGPLPSTLRSFTGGGGEHRILRRPGGPLGNGAHKLGAGLDVKLGGRGYIVLPESVHPVTGRRYRWDNPAVPPAAAPNWLTALLRPELPRPRPARPALRVGGERPGDRLAELVTWADLLEPQGWQHASRRGEIDYWRRPGKTDGVSASTNALGTDRLHVFTSSAPPFEPDTSYSKFGAWAVLYAAGDHSEAARMLRAGVIE